MPTIGGVYNPLVEAAKQQDASGFRMLEEIGAAILAANPGRCPDLADGVRAARRNLDYYCQYFDEETAATVKQFYGLGAGFRDLAGSKHAFV